MRTRLWLLGAAGFAAGIGAYWVASHAGYDVPRIPDAPLALLVGWSYIGSGLLSWRARPGNRLGPAMIATGFVWFAIVLVDAHNPALFTLGLVFEYVSVAGFVYVVLSFPSGRLPGRLDRVLVAAAAFLVTAVQLASVFVTEPHSIVCTRCPANLLELTQNDSLAKGLQDFQKAAGADLLFIALLVLVVRWRRSSRAQRRAVAPVILAGTLTLCALIALIADDLSGRANARLLDSLFYYTFATVPVAVLFVFLQRQLARAGIAGLVVELGRRRADADLRVSLARALGDPSLELAYWFPAESRYVGSDGRPVVPPEPGGDRSSTVVERDGQPIALLIHDPALQHNAELVDSVTAAAGLTLENERLQAELRARLAELQASRARLVEATESERRRIERDLHDGTQQRLVSMAMSLGLLESRLGDPERAKPIVRETRQALTAALAELRVLTQGIHPTILAERGLPAALDELSRRAALPVRLRVSIDGRLPDQVEGAAYFFVSEALTNAAKHSHATDVEIDATREGTTLRVEVRDNGIGGAVAGGGSGLRGLADRVEALGGTLTVSSPPGRGTTLTAAIPCA